MQTLTERQRRVLEFIQAAIETKGYPPTLREIGNFMQIRSTNGVNDHLRALERKGYLTREDMKSRTLRPTAMAGGGGNNVTRLPLPAARAAEDDDMITIPILGRVAAGRLQEAVDLSRTDAAEDSVKIDRMLIGRGARDVFGLRIHGDSMIDAGIHDGDYVFVRKQLEANRGEIVVAMVGEEATCKRYFPEKDHIRLQPENATMAPILVPKTEWLSTRILGVVVGVYRKI
ncbi:MAG: transcriptional repressor LexA [Sandaracinaceae bacterium]|nr:transcriptional repressor LexA [Sandaracinaceae bacterium]